MKQDFITLAGEVLPKLRLIAEGAVLRFEGELMDLASDGEAAVALNDVGAALYLLRAEISELQSAYNRTQM